MSSDATCFTISIWRRCWVWARPIFAHPLCKMTLLAQLCRRATFVLPFPMAHLPLRRLSSSSSSSWMPSYVPVELYLWLFSLHLFPDDLVLYKRPLGIKKKARLPHPLPLDVQQFSQCFFLENAKLFKNLYQWTLMLHPPEVNISNMNENKFIRGTPISL